MSSRPQNSEGTTLPNTGFPGNDGDTLPPLNRPKPEDLNRLLEQIDSHSVEVPVQIWMDAFLSSKSPTEEQLAGLSDYSVLRSSGKKGRKLQDSTMYPILCKNINEICENAGSQLACKDVADWPDGRLPDIKPELAFYVKREIHHSAPWSLSGRSKDTASSPRRPYAARCSWAHMQVVVEVKRQEDDTGFYFSRTGLDKSFLRDSEAGRKARAQHALYPTEMMLRQHRRHAVSICVTNEYLRGFFWDRNGLVASEAIDMKKNPDLANTFFWRLVTLDEEGLGHDPTAQLAGPQDLQRLSMYRPQGPGSEQLQSRFHHMWNHQMDFPIYKIRCAVVQDDGDGQAADAPPTKSFLIGQPVSNQYSLTGRATRGYVAYDIEDNTLVFLKDQWRSHAKSNHPELETYRRLEKHNVSFVATAIAGGDVIDPRTGGPQTTVSQKYLEKYSHMPDSAVPTARIHTRLVVHQVGRPLEEYRNSIELIWICLQALSGLKEAWEKAGILHRDVSVANIMIDVRSPSAHSIGFLNDWDICMYAEDLDDPSEPPGISGTWPYVSALSLLYPRKPSEVADDQESIIYALLYCAVRFHHHNLSPSVKPRAQETPANSPLATLVHRFFYDDSIAPEGGYYLAGKCKQMYIESGRPPIQLQDQDSPLARLLNGCFKLLQKHYRRTDYAALQQYRLEPQADSDAGEEGLSPEGSASARYVREEFGPGEEPNQRSQRKKVEEEEDVDSDSDSDTGPQTRTGRDASQGRKRRPLDTHDQLWKLFLGAFKGTKL